MGIPLAHLVSTGLLCVCSVEVKRPLVVCGSVLSSVCVCFSYHISLRIDGLESVRGMEGGHFVLAAVTWSAGTFMLRFACVPSGVGHLGLYLVCLRRFVQSACMGIPLGLSVPVGLSLLRVVCGVVWTFCFFSCCAACFGALVPLFLPHTFLVS